jgi:DNA-binding SARP family transcriptional activator
MTHRGMTDQAMVDELEIRLFGPLAVVRGGRPLPEAAWHSRQERRLLGALLTHRGAAIPAERLIDWLWPGGGASAGTLRSAVSNLRRALEPDAAARAPHRYILTRQGGYAWNTASRTWIDVDEFLAALRPADGQRAPTLAALERAVALYRGDYLADEPDAPWAAAERERLHERYLAAVQLLAEARLAAGDAAAAIEAARRGLEREPLREPLWRALMLAQARAGDTAGALQSYERYRQALDEALGAAPSLQTRELHGAILRGEIERAAPRAFARAEAAPVAPPAETAATAGPPLVGRDAELAALRGWIDAAVAGHGGVVMIAGEAGIGKTALARAARALALERGALAITVRASPLERALPFAPLSEALRPLLRAAPDDMLRRLPRAALAQVAALLPLLRERLPDLPLLAPATPGERENQLLDGLVDLALALADEQPLLIICDDAQWADDATLTAISRLGRRAGRRRLLIVLAYRPEELAENPALHALLRTLGREMLLRPLLLARLAPGDVARLLAAQAGTPPERLGALAAALTARTGGNPLFLALAVQALLETYGAPSLAALLTAHGAAPPLPDLAGAPGIRDMVLARVAQLPESARTLLEQLAVIGRLVSLDLIERLAGPEGLDAAQHLLERRLLVEGDGGRLAFEHELVRAIVSAALPSPRRRLLHRRAAEAIAALHGRRPERAAEIAYHAGASGRGAEADVLRYATRAGDHARRNFGYRQALEHYEAAVRAAETLGAAAGGDDVRRAYTGRLRTYEALLDWEGITDTVARYVAWMRAAGQVGPPLASARRLALLRALTGDLAGAYAMRAAAPPEAASVPALADLARRTALILQPMPPLPEGPAPVQLVGWTPPSPVPGDPAAELPALLGEDEAALALFEIGWAALTQGLLGDAEPALRRAYELACETGQAATAVASALQLAHLASLRGDPTETARWLDTSLGLAAQAPEAAWAAIWPRIHQGFLWLLDERLDDAQARFAQMAAQLAPLPAFQSHRAGVTVGLGLVALARGELAAADRLLGEALASRQLLHGFVAVAAQHGAARLAALRGDLLRARAILALALRESAARGLLPEYVRTVIEIARIERDFGEPVLALELLRPAAAWAEEAGLAPLAAAASGLAGRLELNVTRRQSDRVTR